MRAALIGWLLFVVAVVGGYAWGVHRRNARLERSLRQEKELKAGAKRRAVSVPKISTSTIPMDLPSDVRRSDSIPNVLE